MWDDLLVNGTSLSSFGVIEDFSGIAAEAPLRGSNLVIPGRAGAIHTPKVRAAYEFLVPLALLAADHGGRMQVIAALKAVLNSASTPLVLTRRLTVGVAQVTQTAAGDYVSGLEPVFIGSDTARVPLLFENLDGGWT